ncbi:unnamed protein product [Pleuronectes platessa]|uniref:Uncharacterized protein n=1 Tax=Pleuronectes platessa TaxID=8262 RepID=A0A9N7TNE8_PLEPL|nr:unnamed protein product [Pleuronectes platessa]
MNPPFTLEEQRRTSSAMNTVEFHRCIHLAAPQGDNEKQTLAAASPPAASLLRGQLTAPDPHSPLSRRAGNHPQSRTGTSHAPSRLALARKGTGHQSRARRAPCGYLIVAVTGGRSRGHRGLPAADALRATHLWMQHTPLMLGLEPVEKRGFVAFT